MPSAFCFSIAAALGAAAAGEVQTRAAAATPEGDVAPYVLSERGAERPAWLDFGFELRLRGEGRSLRLRSERVPGEGQLGLTRARLFVGVAPRGWPVSFTLEAQDARQFATDLPATPATVNELDLLQLRADLDLASALGAPVRIQAGRTSFDAIDRRLVARNRFRNTTNAFEGLRLRYGQERSLGIEALALWPTARRIEALDRADQDRRLLGAIGTIRGARFSFEPYYLHYDAGAEPRLDLHTTGAHWFGALGESWDHDFHVALQFGSASGEEHQALAFHGELGRTSKVAWNPRFSVWLNYASGDARPDDGKSGRFDPLFGASHAMYGFTDLFSWQNLVNPTAALSLRPRRSLRVEGIYRLSWLASAADAFVRAGLRDPEGQSGSFLGQEIDVQVRWQVLPFVELDVQFGSFFAGGFVKRTGGGTGARIFTVAVTVDPRR